MSDESNKFGANLKKIRKEKKLTLKELAEKAGSSDSYLSQLETGKRNPPKPDLLKKIAQSLGETPNEKSVYYHRLMATAGYELSNEDIEDKLQIASNLALELSQKIGGFNNPENAPNEEVEKIIKSHGYNIYKSTEDKKTLDDLSEEEIEKQTKELQQEVKEITQRMGKVTQRMREGELKTEDIDLLFKYNEQMRILVKQLIEYDERLMKE